MQYKLTVCMVTYNQENYIAEALESIVTQKTNFAFQILVGDDASSDKTPEIVKKYAEKYPDIVKPILREKNLGPNDNSLDLYRQADSEYVAICDGDDYWIDDNKLQKQVDFLNQNQSVDLCFHPVLIKYQNQAKKDRLYPKTYHPKMQLKALLKENFIQTNSVVYRWAFRKKTQIFPNNIAPGDWFLHLAHAKKGSIGFLSGVMAVYRKHDTGIWTKTSEEEWYCRYGLYLINFNRLIEKEFDTSKQADTRKTMFMILYSAISTKSDDLINTVKNNYTHEYDDCLKHLGTDHKYQLFKYKVLSLFYLPRRKRYKEQYKKLFHQVQTLKTNLFV